MPKSPIFIFRADPPASASVNMARDSAFLDLAQSANHSQSIFFRVYSWQQAAISLGRHQNPERLLNREAFKRIEKGQLDLVKRPTGGRAVLHHKELSYALAASYENKFFGSGLRESMHAIALLLQDFLLSLGLPANLLSINTETRNQAMVDCYAMEGFAEILLDRQKLIGSAQRRSHNAFMQHGSLPLFTHTLSLQEFLQDSTPKTSASLPPAPSKPIKKAYLENFIKLDESDMPALQSRFVSFFKQSLQSSHQKQPASQPFNRAL